MNYENYIVLKETVMKAKMDLATSISQEILDKLLEKRFIEIEGYLEAKNAKEALDSLINNFSQTIEDYEKKLSNEEIFGIESSIIASFLNYNNWDEWINSFRNENPNIKLNDNLSNMQITNKIAKLCGYKGWNDLFENYPYSIPKENKILEDMVK